MVAIAHYERPSQIIHKLAVPIAIQNSTNDHSSSSSNNELANGHAGSAPVAIQHLPEHYPPLLHLPIELVLLIGSKLDLNSLYTLTHCCRLLRHMLRPEVYNRFRRTLAPWANTPIVCAGRYLDSNPPGITTQVSTGFTLDLEGEISLEECNHLAMYHFIRSVSRTMPPTSSLSPPTLNPPRDGHMTGSRYRPPWQRILELQQFFPPGRGWVLRNLTRKEYVYAHALASWNGQGGGPDHPGAANALGFTLGTVVEANTCWSPIARTGMPGDNIHGKWTGNCFDIVEENKLLDDMKTGGEWVDVSYREWNTMMELNLFCGRAL